MRRRGALVAAHAAWVMATAVLTVSCSTTVPGSAGVDSSDVVAYRAEVTAQAQARAARARADADYRLCAAVVPVLASSARRYNDFIAALNATHDFSALRGADTAARAELDRIATTVVAATAETTSADLRTATATAGRRGQTLAATIAGRRAGALNADGAALSRARDDVLALCGPRTAATGAASPTG